MIRLALVCVLSAHFLWSAAPDYEKLGVLSSLANTQSHFETLQQLIMQEPDILNEKFPLLKPLKATPFDEHQRDFLIEQITAKVSNPATQKDMNIQLLCQKNDLAVLTPAQRIVRLKTLNDLDLLAEAINVIKQRKAYFAQHSQKTK